MAAKILIVDDEKDLLELLSINLSAAGYIIRTAQSGAEALSALRRDTHDLILLDIMLDDISGIKLAARIKNTPETAQIPIIMLTAKDTETDVIVGLSVGADDYVTKPFSIKELLARAGAFLRRRKQEERNTYEFADFVFDISARSLSKNGCQIKLSPKEYKLLEFFIKRQGKALTRDEILNAVWGYNSFAGHRSVDRFVTTLRNKIEPDPHNPTFIHTLREIGYKFEIP